MNKGERVVGGKVLVLVNTILGLNAKSEAMAEAKDRRKYGETVCTAGVREDGSWVLMRLSGTEPVVRVYCEAPAQDELDKLVESAKKFVMHA